MNTTKVKLLITSCLIFFHTISMDNNKSIINVSKKEYTKRCSFLEAIINNYRLRIDGFNKKLYFMHFNKDKVFNYSFSEADQVLEQSKQLNFLQGAAGYLLNKYETIPSSEWSLKEQLWYAQCNRLQRYTEYPGNNVAKFKKALQKEARQKGKSALLFKTLPLYRVSTDLIPLPQRKKIILPEIPNTALGKFISFWHAMHINRIEFDFKAKHFSFNHFKKDHKKFTEHFNNFFNFFYCTDEELQNLSIQEYSSLISSLWQKKDYDGFKKLLSLLNNNQRKRICLIWHFIDLDSRLSKFSKTKLLPELKKFKSSQPYIFPPQLAWEFKSLCDHISIKHKPIPDELAII